MLLDFVAYCERVLWDGLQLRLRGFYSRSFLWEGVHTFYLVSADFVSLDRYRLYVCSQDGYEGFLYVGSQERCLYPRGLPIPLGVITYSYTAWDGDCSEDSLLVLVSDDFPFDFFFFRFMLFFRSLSFLFSLVLGLLFCLLSFGWVLGFLFT